jgi:hypothetical protein
MATLPWPQCLPSTMVVTRLSLSQQHQGTCLCSSHQMCQLRTQASMPLSQPIKKTMAKPIIFYREHRGLGV